MTCQTFALKGDAEGYAAFTFASLAPSLRDVQLPWIATGICCDGVCSGLVLGRLVEKQRALLDSIRVATAVRRQGVGRDLLHAWEQQALQCGATSIWVRYSETLPGLDAFGAFLDSCGWEPEQDWLYKFIGKASVFLPYAHSLKGVQRIFRNQQLSYGPLVLSRKDETEVQRLLAQPAAKLFSHPFDLLSRYGPPAVPCMDLSFAIRFGGKLIGWIVAIQTAPETASRLGYAPQAVVVEYPEMYTDQEMWHTGAGVGAMVLVAERQRELFGDDTIFVYVTNPETPAMVELILRRMEARALRMVRMRQRRKPLTLVSQGSIHKTTRFGM